jgi:tetratricopeptide (TPR) repeat protein
VKRIISFVVFSALLITPLHAQKNNCDFGIKAQRHIDSSVELIESFGYYKKVELLLDAAKELELVLNDNPKCEIIYQQLADVYFSIGQNLISDVGYYAKNMDDVYRAAQNVRWYFSKAKYCLEKGLSFSNDSDYKIEAENSLNEIYYKERDLKEAVNRKIYALILEKEAVEKRKNTDSFFSLGVGYGKTHGQMGVKASLFSQSASGVGIVGGIGYPTDYYFKDDKTAPLLWVVGGGYSWGTYKFSIQLLGLYGKIQTQENFYENTGGLSIASNIKLFSDFALNLDAGYWISDTSDIAAVFGFSAGLCYRFRF